MTTVRDVCTRALRRSGVTSMHNEPSAEEAVEALSLLNEMVYGWKARGVDVLLQAELSLDDAFLFWVPPLSADADTIASATYRGTWNASTNAPTLTSATGTQGDVYRVSTAGTTTLDGLASWAVDDFLIYDGSAWLKGLASEMFVGGVTSMLTVAVCNTYAAPLPPVAVADAARTWATMLPYYCKPPLAGFDTAIRDLPSRGSITYGDLL